MPDDEGTEPKLERLDHESEACFAALSSRIAWELGARIAVGDDPRTPEWLEALSRLLADAILDAFVIREGASPRYGWKK
jgi:hypothetical protein